MDNTKKKRRAETAGRTNRQSKGNPNNGIKPAEKKANHKGGKGNFAKQPKSSYISKGPSSHGPQSPVEASIDSTAIAAESVTAPVSVTAPETVTAVVETEAANTTELNETEIKAEASPVVDAKGFDASKGETPSVTATAETADKKAASKGEKEKSPRQFDEITADISGADAKTAASIDRYISLLSELLMIKELSADQIQFFFASVNECIDDGWIPFLTKASLNINPNKSGNEKKTVDEIIKCCADALDACGLNISDLEETFKTFRENKDETTITNYLEKVESYEPAPDKTELHNITAQELACVTYIYLILQCRSYDSSNYGMIVKVERAIAEHFGNVSMKAQAGKTVGSVLATRAYSPKKIADLTYLYAGTTETIRQQSGRIVELKEQLAYAQSRVAALTNEITTWKANHADLVTRIETLESENDQLRKDRSAAESRLEYETNRYVRQMQTKEEGIAEQLAGDIELEIQAIRETLEYVDEDNQRRIRRRLQRIDDILSDFGGNADA